MSDARKAILFDMDGVIVLTENVKAEAHVKTIERMGGNAQASLYITVLGHSHEEVRSAFLEAAQINADPDEYTKIFRKIYHDLLDEKLEVRPGAVKLIRELQKLGFVLAVVSSSSMSSVMKILRTIGLDDAFEIFVSSDDVKEKKPNPEPYLLALQRLDVSPQNAVIFEDTPPGVEAAIRANVRAIAVRHAYNADQKFEGAYAIVEDFLNTTRILAIVQSILVS